MDIDKPARAKLKKELLALFDTFAVEHPSRHQKKLLNRYVVKGHRLCFAFEKFISTPANIWCPIKVKDFVSGVKNKESPSSELWKCYNAKGELMYGRHGGLKKMKELRDADLIVFSPETSEEGKRVVEGIKKAAAAGIK